MIEYPFIQGLSSTARRRTLEFIAAALAAFLVSAIPDLPYGFMFPYTYGNYNPVAWSFTLECQRMSWSFLCNGFFILLALGPLALAHLLRRPAGFFAGSLLAILGLAAGIAWIESGILAKFQKAIEEAQGWAPPAVSHGLLVPFWAVSWRKLAQFAIPLVIALAACRRRYSHARFISAYLAGCAIVFPLFHYHLLLRLPEFPWFPRIGWSNDWQAPSPSPMARPLATLYVFESFAQLLLAMLLVIPPLNRAALERHLGVPLSAGPRAESPARWGLAARAFAALNLALLLALAAFFARFGFYEAKLARFVIGEETEASGQAEGANAFLLLAPEFESSAIPELSYHMDTAGLAKPRLTATRRLVDVVETSPLYPGFVSDLMPIETANEAIGLLDRAQIARIEGVIAPWLAAMERAGKGERIDFPPGRRLEMHSFQMVSTSLQRRGALRIHGGEWEAALRDIETDIRLGAALETATSFFPWYMGSGLRMHGHALAYRYWQTFRRDPEKLRALEELLLRLRDVDRRGYDPEAIAKASPISWPLVPYFEPYYYNYAPIQSRDRYDAAVVEHDQLECALALERFRAAQGRYPGSLAELIPAYLDAAPHDPKTGKELFYENLGEEFRLCRVKQQKPHWRSAERWQLGLPFPPPAECDPQLEQQLAAARKAKQAATPTPAPRNTTPAGAAAK